MGFVQITHATYEDIYDKIKLAIEGGGNFDIDDGENIVIKINLCDFRMPETGAVTHPVFLDATLDYLRSSFERLKIFVVESDATIARPDLLIRWLGFKPVLEKYDAKYVNLTKEKTTKMPIKGRFFQELKVPNIIVDSDYFISMAKLKTCLLTKISCSLKNQFGCIPIPRKVKFHTNLDDVIVDANLAMRPNYCIVDGIVGMGGVKGPDMGKPIKSNVVVTGKDPVSVDSVCAKIMGFNPYFVGHIRKAQEAGIGRMTSKIIGEDLKLIKKNFEFNYFYARIIKAVMSLK